jgi:hypothetical protein
MGVSEQHQSGPEGAKGAQRVDHLTRRDDHRHSRRARAPRAAR